MLQKQDGYTKQQHVKNTTKQPAEANKEEASHGQIRANLNTKKATMG